MLVVRAQLDDGRSVTGLYVRHNDRSLVLDRWGVRIIIPLVRIVDVGSPGEPETCF